MRNAKPGRGRRGWISIAAAIGLLASVARADETVKPAQPPSGPPGVAAVPVDALNADGVRFAFTPEQKEKLRLAQEAQARQHLGLAPDAPIPAEAALSEDQKQMLRAARDAELRRVLGLAPTDALPTRATATPEQRAKIAAAHEARLREALGLGPDEPLPLAAPPAPASPAQADAGGPTR